MLGYPACARAYQLAFPGCVPLDPRTRVGKSAGTITQRRLVARPGLCIVWQGARGAVVIRNIRSSCCSAVSSHGHNERSFHRHRFARRHWHKVPHLREVAHIHRLNLNLGITILLHQGMKVVFQYILGLWRNFFCDLGSQAALTAGNATYSRSCQGCFVIVPIFVSIVQLVAIHAPFDRIPHNVWRCWPRRAQPLAWVLLLLWCSGRHGSHCLWKLPNAVVRPHRFWKQHLSGRVFRSRLRAFSKQFSQLFVGYRNQLRPVKVFRRNFHFCFRNVGLWLRYDHWPRGGAATNTSHIAGESSIDPKCTRGALVSHFSLDVLNRLAEAILAHYRDRLLHSNRQGHCVTNDFGAQTRELLCEIPNLDVSGNERWFEDMFFHSSRILSLKFLLNCHPLITLASVLVQQVVWSNRCADVGSVPGESAALRL
mmetsp:Transcript_55499/g.99629  ORF Transcript_55499/g.99629 Transcript_55499/m.99629 type:complete len:426 (-) Transcript_55499:643-1920(-)